MQWEWYSDSSNSSSSGGGGIVWCIVSGQLHTRCVARARKGKAYVSAGEK